ncbi:MAG: hypothetical protein LUF87_03240 [Alistipes sp.]|nr:hypothetical protein [Alistipes sp.]
MKKKFHTVRYVVAGPGPVLSPYAFPSRASRDDGATVDAFEPLRILGSAFAGR